MSSLPYPSDFDIDRAAERRWAREAAILRTLDVGDVLAEIDDLIALEVNPEGHPLYHLVAFLLDHCSVDNAEALWGRCQRLADHAIERVIEQRLAAGED
jgi:hypothetical protein